MHVEFKHIIIHNFLSFGHVELSFRNDGFIRVTGINENPSDNANSNGSGKSSLWEALVWAITGDTIRGTKQIVNIYGEDGCFVEVDFCIDNKQYKLIRSKDHKVLKTNLQIFVDGQDVSGKGIRDSEKLLQQYLPDLTASLIGSVIILGQGLPQKFTNNTPSGRKEVLEKLSKSDFMIEDLKLRVSNRKSDLTKEYKSIEDALLELTTQKDLLSSQIQQSEAILTDLDLNMLTGKLAECTSQRQSVETELLSQKCECDNLNEKVNRIVEQQALVIAEQNNELSIAKSDYESICAPYVQSCAELNAKLSVYNSELTKIRSIKDICPTCGQRITSVHKPDTTDLEQNICSITAEVGKVSILLDKHKCDYEESLKNIYNKYKDKKAELVLLETNTSAELAKLKSVIRAHETTYATIVNTISDIEKQIVQFQSMVDIHNNIIRDNNEKLKIIEEKILYNIVQKDLTTAHLEIITKFDTALKRDFRGYLLSTVIEYIESRSKQYCKVIFDTTDIGFCLNGNNIDINYMNKAYENLSGGEQQKIDLIIQFSIRDMLLAQLNFTCNILVLDEIFDGLDTIGCNRVIDMISNLSDVKNVFIVTHRKDLSIPNDKELTVVKSSVGISEIME